MKIADSNLEMILTFLGIRFIDHKGRRTSNGHNTAKTIGEIKNFFGKEVMTSGQFIEDIDFWNFENDWNDLIFLIKYVAQKTGYSLTMYENTSYWVGDLGQITELKERGGYDDISNIYEQAIDFIDWYNLQNGNI